MSILRNFSMNGINFVGNLFESSGNLKPWVKIKGNLHLLESSEISVDTINKCFRYNLENKDKFG